MTEPVEGPAGHEDDIDAAPTVSVEAFDAVAVEVVGDESRSGSVLDDDEVLLLEEADGPLVLPVWEPTGEPRVDAALDRLGELDDDIHQHAAIFDDVHRQLRSTLTDLDPSV
jgi:hypothetical protein